MVSAGHLRLPGTRPWALKGDIERGSLKWDIDIDIDRDVDVEADVDTDSYLGCLKGGMFNVSSGTVEWYRSSYGTELIILKWRTLCYSYHYYHHIVMPLILTAVMTIILL